MSMVEERMHIFDTVRQYIYEQDHINDEVRMPEMLDVQGFNDSLVKARILNRLGLLGEFYNRIVNNTL